MKDFIKKITIFIFLAIVLVTLIIITPNLIIRSKSNFKIDKNTTTLILGHSHSACALNDSILNNSINLSVPGESYFYNYQKLKLIVKNNKQINTVFIEFTNNQIDSLMNDWTWGFEKMSQYLPYYSPFLEQEDINLLLTHNSTDLISSYSIATRKHMYRLINGDYNLVDEIGGYYYSKQSKVDSLITNNNFNYSLSKSRSISETNITYLRKMIDFCKDNNIRVFLIRSPQHPLYADLINEDVYQNILKTQFNDVELLDFNTMNFPNSHYLDLCHLNNKGANQFTALLNSLIEEKDILNSKNKQALIEKDIKKTH